MKRPWAWVWRQGPIGAAFLMLGVGAILSGVYQVADEATEAGERAQHRAEVVRLRMELECRFQLSLPVQDAQAEKLDALAQGLVQSRIGTEADVQRQIERIQSASRKEADALAAREQAVEECRERVGELVSTP